MFEFIVIIALAGILAALSNLTQQQKQNQQNSSSTQEPAPTKSETQDASGVENKE